MCEGQASKANGFRFWQDLVIMSPELVLVLLWAGWVLSWLLVASWSARTVQRSGGQIPYRILTVIGFILLLGFWSPRHRLLQLWQLEDGWKWAMAGVAGLGFAFCWWARLHLGQLWSATITRKEDHHVVNTGPYASVRHPIYTGLALAAVATAIQRGTMIALAGSVLLIGAFYIKARLEERFLREELGAKAYDAYAARVPMFIPFPGF
jgi:protein-S-isoprenylcysteine O-methyltransferase Ste14